MQPLGRKPKRFPSKRSYWLGKDLQWWWENICQENKASGRKNYLGSICAFCEGSGICEDEEGYEWPCPQRCSKVTLGKNENDIAQ